MCAALARLGYAVTLYHSSPGASSWSAADRDGVFARYGIATRFELANIPSGGGPLRHIWGLRAAARVRTAPGERLVFSRFLPAAAWCSLFGIPTIQEFHVPPALLTERVYLRLMLAGRGFRKIVTITSALRGALERSVPTAKAADVIVEADGVNLEEYRPDAARDIPDDLAALRGRGPLVGYVGSLHPGKGAELILQIGQLLPQLQFVVVGGPEERAAQFRAASAAAKVHNVAWLGFRQNVDVPAYVQACDVLLLPNQRRVVLLGRQDIGQWTSPLKLFEYMAAGKIIVASDLPVLREVLNSANAVLCDPEDPTAWARELSRIAAGLPGYSELAARARQDVSRYDWVERARRCVAAATGRPVAAGADSPGRVM
jgi:glycosyltransferase involved in cell wall biosynthesis